MVLNRSKKPHPVLHLRAVKGHVRAVEPDGSVSADLTPLGYRAVPGTYQQDADGLTCIQDLEIIPEGVVVNTSNHALSYYVNEVKLGHLEAVDADTQALVGKV
jgi:hypothetical protein